MIEKFKILIFLVQKKIGKQELRREDFIKIISFENRWMEPSYVDKFIENCVKLNLLKKVDNSYVPQFSFKDIEIPVDFEIAPQEIELKEEKGEEIFMVIIDRIEKSTGKKKNEIVSEINRMRSKNKYFTVEVYALIYAVENNVDVRDIIQMYEEKLLK